MVRDDDYMRELLLELEASPDWSHLSYLAQDSDAAAFRRHYHVLLLVDAGLLAPTSFGATSYRITNAGHDFIAVTRQNEAWEATKAATRHMGGASVQMLYRVAEALAINGLKAAGVL